MGKQRGNRRKRNSIQPDGTIPAHIRPSMPLIRARSPEEVARLQAMVAVPAAPPAEPSPQLVAKVFDAGRPQLLGSPEPFEGTVVQAKDAFVFLESTDGRRCYLQLRRIPREAKERIAKGDIVHCTVQAQADTDVLFCLEVGRIDFVVPPTSRPKPKPLNRPDPQLEGLAYRFDGVVTGYKTRGFIYLEAPDGTKAFMSGHLLTLAEWESVRRGVAVSCLVRAQKGHPDAAYAVELLGMNKPQECEPAQAAE